MKHHLKEEECTAQLLCYCIVIYEIICFVLFKPRRGRRKKERKKKEIEKRYRVGVFTSLPPCCTE